MEIEQDILVEALLNPACYAHPTPRIEQIQTHISRVFLAGDFAYKLKKPLNFGFLDFSSLEKRRHYCQEELRLNRRFAPQLYLDVVTIGGPPGALRIGATPTLDYLVKMKRFPRKEELDRLLEQHRLSPAMIEQFACYLANLHHQAPVVPIASDFGSPTAVWTPVEENFAQLRPLLPDVQKQILLDRIAQWCNSSFEQIQPLLLQRKQTGMIRECHGDVHLANMLWHEKQPLLFDCIEFNDNFRCIDTLNDCAFLLMDLDDRGASQLGWSFLNRYLQQSGDYAGLVLLNFYKCYRAMVRAKVIGLRLQQPDLPQLERNQDQQLLQSYLELAGSYARSRQPWLLISHGPSGSGKSTLVRELAPQCGAISIHSDIERKRLHGLEATEQSQSAPAAGIYTEQAGQQTYARLLQLAETILDAGLPVIVDATFLAERQRAPFLELSERLELPLIILDFALEQQELYRRVEQRRSKEGQISEATLEVLKKQLAEAQPLTAAEEQVSIRVESTQSTETIAAQVLTLVDNDITSHWRAHR